MTGDHRISIGIMLSAFLLTACTASASNGLAFEPISNAANRPTPLSFGLYVTPDPAKNPIDPPERFIGYHNAVDFEVSSDELDEDVPIYAVCDGTMIYSGFAEGYGGLLMQSCTLGGEDVTILYGHLQLDGLPEKGATVTAGDQIAILAPARSHDSDDNRKHLHFGIHRGTALTMLGYVQNKSELKNYINAKPLLPTDLFSSMEFSFVPYWAESDTEKTE